MVETVAIVGVGMAPVVGAGIQKKEANRISKADFQGAKFILRSLGSKEKSRNRNLSSFYFIIKHHCRATDKMMDKIREILRTTLSH